MGSSGGSAPRGSRGELVNRPALPFPSTSPRDGREQVRRASRVPPDTRLRSCCSRPSRRSWREAALLPGRSASDRTIRPGHADRSCIFEVPVSTACSTIPGGLAAPDPLFVGKARSTSRHPIGRSCSASEAPDSVFDREQPVLPVMPGIPECRTRSYGLHGAPRCLQRSTSPLATLWQVLQT